MDAEKALRILKAERGKVLLDVDIEGTERTRDKLAFVDYLIGLAKKDLKG